MKTEDFILMPVPAAMFTAVCALLGGAAAGAIVGTGARAILGGDNSGDNSGNAGSTGDASSDTAGASAGSETLAPENQASAGSGPSATTGASPSDDGELDAHGWPWSPDMHASTKGKTKEGLWRMKVGVSRPDPKPGFPVESGGQSAATGTSSETSAPSATSSTATDQASGQPSTSTGEDEDEFAAFRAAAEASNATDAAAAASVPARQYSDADLGALCNQAAVKLGDPAPVKAVIAKYVPAGEVVHSRNIPTDKRGEFVAEVETTAGIQFAG